jgi:hypothetical protein
LFQWKVDTRLISITVKVFMLLSNSESWHKIDLLCTQKVDTKLIYYITESQNLKPAHALQNEMTKFGFTWVFKDALITNFIKQQDRLSCTVVATKIDDFTDYFFIFSKVDMISVQ